KNVPDASAPLRDIEPATRAARSMQDSQLKTSSRAMTDEARAAVWTGILGAAGPLGEGARGRLRQPPPAARPRRAPSATPIYFTGARPDEPHRAQLTPPQHSIFSAEITWPSAW